MFCGFGGGCVDFVCLLCSVCLFVWLSQPHRRDIGSHCLHYLLDNVCTLICNILVKRRKNLKDNTIRRDVVDSKGGNGEHSMKYKNQRP